MLMSKNIKNDVSKDSPTLILLMERIQKKGPYLIKYKLFKIVIGRCRRLMEIETEYHFPLHRLFLNTLLSLAQFLDGTLDTTSNNNVFAENLIVLCH